MSEENATRAKLPVFKAEFIEGHISLPSHLDRQKILSKQLGSDKDLFGDFYSQSDDRGAPPRLIEPLYDPEMLTRYPEVSGELWKNIEAMVQNVDGFGYDLDPIYDPVRDKDKITPEIQAQIDAEWAELKNVLDFGCVCDDAPVSHRQLRKRTTRAALSTGFCGWEVLRNGGDPNGKPVGFSYVRGYQIRMSSLSRPVDCEVLERRYKPDRTMITVKVKKKRRFRLFLQKTPTSQRWFKEVGDPRTIHNKTGQEIHRGTPVNQDDVANELIFFSAGFSDVSPYSLPPWIGNALLVDGDRSAEEVNYATMENDCVPPIAICVSGVDAKATQGTENRIKNFQNRPRDQKRNRGSILLLEAETSSEGIETGAAKIDVKKLGDMMAKDSMFQNYQEHNSKRLKSNFRIHSVFHGEASSRQEVETATALCDKQVFQPVRDDFDDRMNLVVFPILGARFHTYKSRGPRIVNDEILVKVLNVAERSGGLNPEISRQILGEIMNRDLGPVDGVDPKKPASFQIAEIVSNLRTNVVRPGGGERSDSKVVQLMKQILTSELDGSDYQEQIRALEDRFNEVVADFSRNQLSVEKQTMKDEILSSVRSELRREVEERE